MLKQPLRILLALASMVGACQGLPSQLKLGGFQLGQVARVTEATFGKPYEERTTSDGWLIKAFWTSEKHEHLLIFEFAAPKKDRITAIQLFGKPTPGDGGLPGVTLGSTESEVLKSLGPPKSKSKYMDDGTEYTRLDYADRNYSLELNHKGLVVSIRIFGFGGFPKEVPPLPTAESLKKILAKQDPEALEAMLTPDFEFYRGDNIISYNGPSETEIRSNPKIKEAIYGPRGLNGALSSKDAQEDPQIRLSESGVFHVIKFPKSAVLKEIVFAQFAGSWRIYEVSFKP